jgi:hypothetical protein
VLLHVCEQAHTRELDIAHLSLQPHLYAYGRATRKFSRGSGAPTILFQRNPNPWAPQIYPLAFSMRGCTNGLFYWFRFV